MEKELSSVFIEIAKEETNFWRVTELYFKVLKDGGRVNKDEITDEDKKIMAKIFILFVGKMGDYCRDLVEGEFKFTNKDLDKLGANFEEILKTVDLLHDKCPQVIGADYVARTKENMRESKKLIQLGREFANLEDKLNKFKKENFSWQEVKKIWNEVKEKSSTSRSTEWLTKAARIQKWGFLGEIAEPCWEVAEAVAKGGKQDILPEIYPSTAEDLNFFQEIADEVPKLIDFLESSQAGEIKDKETKIQVIKGKNEKLKSFIQEQQKKIRGHSSTNQPKQPNPQDQQKIQNQEKEIELLKKQLTELQNQIEELKKNQNNSTDDQITIQIKSLQNKKQEIQSELNKKQTQQKELQDKVNSSQSNKSNDFNWLYVVIPGGILLVIMGIVIAYLMGKKSKRS